MPVQVVLAKFFKEKGRETRVPGEKPFAGSKGENQQQTQLTYGVEPRPHGWEASALTTAPPLVPSSGGW